MAKTDPAEEPRPTPPTALLTEPGQPAPSFELPDQEATAHRLEDYAGRWLVLYFYPKDNTSGCTKQACQFRDALAALSEEGAALLGVSPDSPQSHRGFIQKQSLNFPLLADTEKQVCAAYGVWQEKSMYGKKYMGVVRTTYLIDPQSRVAHRWDKVKVPNHDQAVLERLRELKNG
jgi:peroxiredoxin Q/BCP